MAVIYSQLRILIVDDDRIMRTFLAETLSRIGVHQVQECGDGKSALIAVIKFQPHLVLSDIHMQPMNGIDFVKALHALPNRAVAATRVIFMSADASKETLNEALPLGIRGYMIKPPSVEMVKSRIEAALK